MQNFQIDNDLIFIYIPILLYKKIMNITKFNFVTFENLKYKYFCYHRITLKDRQLPTLNKNLFSFEN